MMNQVIRHILTNRRNIKGLLIKDTDIFHEVSGSSFDVMQNNPQCRKKEFQDSWPAVRNKRLS